MLKQLLLAAGLLAATHAQAAEVSMNYVEAGTYLLIALSDTEEEYVIDADLLHSACIQQMKDFDLNTTLGILRVDTLQPVKFVDVFCLRHSGDF